MPEEAKTPKLSTNAHVWSFSFLWGTGVEVGKGRRVEEHKKCDRHAETSVFVMFGQTDRSQTPIRVSAMCLNGRRAGGEDEKWGER